MSVFCRHNRFTADCPICSKGTVLDPGRRGKGRSPPRRRDAGTGGRGERTAPPAFSGPHASAGPYTDEEGVSYTVRLERVPGGVRLAEWAGSALRRRAPVLPSDDLVALASGAMEALPRRDAEALGAAVAGPPRDGGAGHGVSRGRTGEFSDELRVEPAGEGRLRVARWIMRPGAGWQLQDAPPMLPAARFAEALAGAAAAGLLASGAGDPARP